MCADYLQALFVMHASVAKALPFASRRVRVRDSAMRDRIRKVDTAASIRVSSPYGIDSAEDVERRGRSSAEDCLRICGAGERHDEACRCRFLVLRLTRLTCAYELAATVGASPVGPSTNSASSSNSITTLASQAACSMHFGARSVAGDVHPARQAHEDQGDERRNARCGHDQFRSAARMLQTREECSPAHPRRVQHGPMDDVDAPNHAHCLSPLDVTGTVVRPLWRSRCSRSLAWRGVGVTNQDPSTWPYRWIGEERPRRHC